MGPLEAMVFLDASSYFWTRRGISARVHNERAAGRAGGGRMAKLFLDTSSGERAGGQAAKVISAHIFSKIISGHVSGRAGGRTGCQSYFWTRLAISGCVVVFLHAFITSRRAGGRGKDGKTISGHVFGRAGGRTGCQSYFWTRLQQNYFWARLRAGGRAGGQAGKVISGRVLLFLDASWYFCTRLAISGRVVVFLHAFITSGRAGGRARKGGRRKIWEVSSLKS